MAGIVSSNHRALNQSESAFNLKESYLMQSPMSESTQIEMGSPHPNPDFSLPFSEDQFILLMEQTQKVIKTAEMKC